MQIKMIYRNGKKFYIKYLEITSGEAEVWVNSDYEKRLKDAPEEGKKNIKKRTPQEIADDLNRQEERFNKANMREKAKLVSSTVFDDDNEEVSRMDLIPDKSTLSPLESCLLAEEQEEKIQKIHDAKAQLYSNLTKTQARRLEMKNNGMTIRDIAKAEGVNFKSVKESLDQVDAKIKKLFKNTPTKP